MWYVVTGFLRNWGWVEAPQQLSKDLFVDHYSTTLWWDTVISVPNWKTTWSTRGMDRAGRVVDTMANFLHEAAKPWSGTWLISGGICHVVFWNAVLGLENKTELWILDLFLQVWSLKEVAGVRKRSIPQSHHFNQKPSSPPMFLNTLPRFHVDDVATETPDLLCPCHADWSDPFVLVELFGCSMERSNGNHTNCAVWRLRLTNIGIKMILSLRNSHKIAKVEMVDQQFSTTQTQHRWPKRIKRQNLILDQNKESIFQLSSPLRSGGC